MDAYKLLMRTRRPLRSTIAAGGFSAAGACPWQGALRAIAALGTVSNLLLLRATPCMYTQHVHPHVYGTCMACMHR